MAFEKRYNFALREKEILNLWNEKKIYRFNEDTDKEIFSIDTPPPTVSGKMHIGHAFSYTQADFIARFKRMSNFEVFYPFGTDNNGLATEKLIQKELKVDLRAISRDEAIKICNNFLEKQIPLFLQDFKDIGLSADFNINYSTIDDRSRRLSQKTFIELYKKGLIYKKNGPVMWDRIFQTAIAQVELEDKEIDSSMNYLKAKIKGSKRTYMIFATTRPELIFACQGFSLDEAGDYVKVAVDNEYWIISAKTYKENFSKFKIDNYNVIETLKGEDLTNEKVLIPIINKELPITHDTNVKAEFGTGIAYFCSYGGIEDIEYFARHNLEPITILNKDGTLNEQCGEFEGLITTKARPKIIQKLKDLKILIFSENIKHIVNICERSGVEVEYIVAKQWYVKYLDKKEKFFEFAEKLNFYPEFMKHRLINWIKGLKWDWGFSRERHFGIPIPVWTCKQCGKILLPDEKDLPIDPLKDKPKISCDCGSSEFIPEKDIIDTWFTSASTPFLAIENINSNDMKKKLFPMNLRPQAHDIISFWLFYSMAKTNLLFEQNPFKDVMISGWVLDSKGQKMSKSKGNVISPQSISKEHSYDALRFASSSTKLGYDANFQEKNLLTGKKIISKLYNANKFASMLLDDFQGPTKIEFENITPIEKWIISRIQEISKSSRKAFENYDYYAAIKEWTTFFMNEVADNFLEIFKDKLWKKKEGYKSVQNTLYYVLFSVLRGLAPVFVFITEDIYLNFYKQFENKESIHLNAYPKYDSNYYNNEQVIFGQNLINLISQVRKFKSDNKLSLKSKISSVEIRSTDNFKKNLENSLSDFKAVTGIENIKFIKTDNDNVEIRILN